jgi:cysteine desulfurase
MDAIYLDHNASSPLDPEVLEAMQPFWLTRGNPESRHSAGRAARRGWESARETVARILDAKTSEVVFTSGGTEANNMAIFGLARAEREAGHLVSSPIEHPAVSAPLARLEAEGYEVTRPHVSAEGIAHSDTMAAALRPDTRLATLILAHNETGAIQPVQQLAAAAADLGVPVHTDAVQAVGRMPVSFRALGVATLAASAHKFHGPAGVGVLLVHEKTRLSPLLLGGGQQQGRRPGTPPVALAVGLAKALERWHHDAQGRMERWTALCARLEKGLNELLGAGAVVLNGPSDPDLRLPQTLNVGFPGLDGNALLMQLDQAGLSVSLGAACASGSTQPSPSFLAMGVPADRLRSSVRFSFGAETTQVEVDEALRRVVRVVASLTAADR